MHAQVISAAHLSSALFAPAWTYENGGQHDPLVFADLDARYASVHCCLTANAHPDTWHGLRFWMGTPMTPNLLDGVLVTWTQVDGGDGWKTIDGDSDVPVAGAECVAWLASKAQWVVISRAMPVPAHSFRRTSGV